MALFDIFKRKKAIKKAAPKRGEPRPAKAGWEAKEKPVVAAKPKKVSEAAYRILKWPHVSEKATALTKNNQYVFNVYKNANKSEIKRTVEDTYGVSVVSLQIINTPKKKRRLGRITGWRQGYKKAVVKLAEGQKIEILPR